MVKYNIDRTFAALADPTRRAILARLATGEASVGELAEPFEMSLPAVSKHLKILEQAGLLERRRDGRTLYCRMEPMPLQDVSEWIARQRAFWEGSLDSLAHYFATEANPGGTRNE
ncbi:MAG: winged helix-turn-helix transcriptional regulator [Alphaproteobacteria bacterium]|jgi:DNA-binding transcriptional ArsR family regulator|nr:winged helix-turn-helix transcriptional regulator [Alphaproteobacteria bacterium]